MSEKLKWSECSKRFKILYLSFVSFLIFLIVMAIKWNITGEIKHFDNWSIEFNRNMYNFYENIGYWCYTFIVKPIGLTTIFFMDLFCNGILFLCTSGLIFPIITILTVLFLRSSYIKNEESEENENGN